MQPKPQSIGNFDVLSVESRNGKIQWEEVSPPRKGCTKNGEIPVPILQPQSFLYLTRKLIFTTVLYYTIGVTISQNIDRATNRGFFPRKPLLKIENRHLAVAFILKKINFLLMLSVFHESKNLTHKIFWFTYKKKIHILLVIWKPFSHLLNMSIFNNSYYLFHFRWCKFIGSLIGKIIRINLIGIPFWGCWYDQITA